MKRILITFLYSMVVKSAVAIDLKITPTDNYLDNNDYEMPSILIDQETNINATTNINNIMTRGSIENLTIINDGNLDADILQIFIFKVAQEMPPLPIMVL